MSKKKTTRQVADRLGLSVRRIHQAARSMGKETVLINGVKVYLFTESEIRKIKARIGKIGHPPN